MEAEAGLGGRIQARLAVAQEVCASLDWVLH